MNLERRFPCIAYMETAAKRRIPRFAWDYMAGGIGREKVLWENIDRLDRIKLKPRYLVDDADKIDTAHSLFGTDYSAPFGVAPLGLSGLVWPGAAQTAIDALPLIRDAVGADFPLLADGGIRNGLDIARYLALGADFVLLGRAFMFALGAIGASGGEHAMSVLQRELRATMGQLGCPRVKQLPEFLIKEK